MTIDQLWKELARLGCPVPTEVQRTVGAQNYGEHVVLRPPGTPSAKVRVLEFGTSVSPQFVARKLGVSVRTVQMARRGG